MRIDEVQPSAEQNLSQFWKGGKTGTTNIFSLAPSLVSVA